MIWLALYPLAWPGLFAISGIFWFLPAGLRLGDVHGPAHLVELREYEGGERLRRRGGGDLPVGGVEAVEGDRVAGFDLNYWRDAVVVRRTELRRSERVR